MFHRAVCTLAGTLEQLCLSLAERNPCCKQKQKQASVASNVLYDSSGLDRKNVKKIISKVSVLAHKLVKLNGQMAALKFYQNSKIANFLDLNNLQPHINISLAYFFFNKFFTITQKPNIAYVTIIKGYDDLLKVLAKILATQHVFSNALQVCSVNCVDVSSTMYEREYHLIL